MNCNIDSSLSYFQEENSLDLDEFFCDVPYPIKNTFSEINKNDSMSKLINNSKLHGLNGQIDTKKKEINLPIFYPIDKIINEYIINKDLKMKLKKGHSIINLIHYKFIELGHKKGMRKYSINKIVNYDGQYRKRGREKTIQNMIPTHTKMSLDNIIKKIKSSLINKFILDFLNRIINLKIKNIKLLKIDYDYINEIKRKKELKYLRMKLKDLFSLNITKKINTHKPDYNKTVIDSIIDKNDTIKFALNLTYNDFIELFLRKKTIEDITNDFNSESETINYKEIKKNIPPFEEFCYEILKKNDVEYTNFIIFFLFNFERALKLKQKRVKRKKNNINSLKDKNKDLNKDKQTLEIDSNREPEKNVFLNQFSIEGENLKNKNNIIRIDLNTNQLIENEKDIRPKFIDFYDLIVCINSIKEINNGWNIEMSPKAKENYEKFKSQKIIKIGIIGNSNKGKSFLLSKISKIELPPGSTIRTEGLSIKYLDLQIFKDRRIALLTSAGLETPILKLDANIKEHKVNEYFKEKSKEKLITELFLQNYIINNSDILIAVVGILTYSEQKLLMKIKKDIENSKINIPLFIIHNLFTYTSVLQVNEYINEYLLNSATFTLVEGHKIFTKIKSKTGRYFFEENKKQKIYHLILANEGSEAGSYFNKYTLDFLENNYQNVTHLQTYDVIETIKDRYIKLSKEIREKAHKRKLINESFDDSVPHSIKLKNQKEMTLKKDLKDELGFSNSKENIFESTYYLRKKDDTLEESRNTGLEPSIIEFDGEYNNIRIKDEKIKYKEPVSIEDNIFNEREYGKFSFEVPWKTED